MNPRACRPERSREPVAGRSAAPLTAIELLWLDSFGILYSPREQVIPQESVGIHPAP